MDQQQLILQLRQSLAAILSVNKLKILYSRYTSACLDIVGRPQCLISVVSRSIFGSDVLVYKDPHPLRCIAPLVILDCRCNFSKGAVGTKYGPTQVQLDGLHRWLEKGYVCGGKVKSFGGKFFYPGEH